MIYQGNAAPSVCGQPGPSSRVPGPSGQAKNHSASLAAVARSEHPLSMSDIDHDVDHDIQPRRAPGWDSLAAAVCELAVRDLGDRHRVIRDLAQVFVESAAFGFWLDCSNVNNSADECRRALRDRGLIPATRHSVSAVRPDAAQRAG